MNWSPREIVSKQSTGKRRPDQDANEALTDLRETDQVPWDWIVDETRSLEDYTGYGSIQEGVLGLLSGISLDPWNGDAPLILTESRSLAGVLRELTSDYCALIAPTDGQCGGFLRTKIAPLLSPDKRVLYLGDWDLCGNMIEANTRRVLEQIVGPLQWERLALTREQVERYTLPKIIKTDRRFKNGGGVHEAVESEALSQAVLVEIVRNRLTELLPEPLETVHEREKVQRRQIERLFARL
jgi:hypothetical protein